MKKRLLLFVIPVISFCGEITAQAIDSALNYYAEQFSPEKLHLHFDRAEELSLAGEKEEKLAIFYKAVQQLGKVEKALIYLYMEDQPYEEIASHLGITEGNVRVRLNRVKNKLKEIIKKMNYEY